MLKEDVYWFLYVKIIEARITSKNLKLALTYGQYLNRVDKMLAIDVTASENQCLEWEEGW